MAKSSLKNKTLSFALALSLVVSLNVPFAAYADEGNANEPRGGQQEQVDSNQNPSSDDMQSQEEVGEIAPYSNNGNNAPAVQAADAMVAEANGTQYASIQEAINANDNATVTLLANITEDITIPAGKTITLNLNGFILSVSKAITVEGNLTVYDSAAASNPLVSSDFKTVNYASGKIICSTGKQTIVPSNGGSFTLESGTIESTGNCGAYAKNNSSIVINGGYVLAQEYGLGVRVGSSVEVNGGVIFAKDNAAIAGNGSNGDGNVFITINEGYVIGNIQSNGYIACGIYMPNSGNVSISGGTIVANNGAGLVMRAGSANITGGVIKATGTNQGGVGDKSTQIPSSAIVFDAGNPGYPGYNATTDKVSISGGQFASNSAVSAIDTIGDANCFDLTGGYYSSDPEPSYIREGYTSIPLDDDPAELYSIEKIAAGDTTAAVVIPPSELEPVLSDTTKDALVDSAKKAAEDISAGKVPSNVAISEEDTQKIKEATASKEENDSVSVKLVVNAIPVYKPEDSPINSAKNNNEEVSEWIDLSIDMVVSVVDANGNTKASATTSVIELNDQITVTISVEPESIQGKNVRIARNHEGVVDFIEPTVNYETGEITFTTNRFSEYAVLTSDKTVEPGVNPGGNPTPGSSTTTTTTVNTEKTSSAKTGDNLGLFAGVAAVAAVTAVALGGFALRRKHD